MSKQVEVYTVEEVEPGVFQSVFPSEHADRSSLHADAEDAWAYIEEMKAEIAEANSQFGVGA